MKKNLISIIVPIYNTENYLRKCIDSIISQSFKDIELILVNDGSTDNCYNICNEYAQKDDRIKVIDKENGGLSDARNFGIKKATGEYILFVDSDDFIEIDSLEYIFKTLNEVPSTDVVFLEAVKYFDDTKKTITLGDGYKKDDIKGKSKEHVIHHLASLPKYPGSACTKLIRRDLIIKNNLFFVKGITNEDLEWTIRLLLSANTFNYCENKYYYYRQDRKGSITNIFTLKKFKNLLDFIKQFSGIDTNDNAHIFKNDIYSFIAYEFNILLASYDKLDRQSKNMYKEEIKSYSWIMNYRNDPKNKIIRTIYKIVGLNITCKLLNLYLNIR